ncbi:hypothetical protein KM043_011234 [Ampulex compressa]|nr:hypothetical protein KM043_011234 [Ampulex compressa]
MWTSVEDMGPHIGTQECLQEVGADIAKNQSEYESTDVSLNCPGILNLTRNVAAALRTWHWRRKEFQGRSVATPFELEDAWNWAAWQMASRGGGWI